MNGGTVRNLNEYKYEKNANETIDLHKDNTYSNKSKQKKWTEKEYAKAYMKMLTAYTNQ